MERLPHFLVEQIFDELSICDAIEASFVSRSWRAALMPYLYSTYNINYYLNDFPAPAAFLFMMRQTNAMLCGSRAIAYFLPSGRDDPNVKASVWEPWVMDHYKYFIHEQLKRQ